MVAYYFSFKTALVKGSPNVVSPNTSALIYDVTDVNRVTPVTAYTNAGLTTIANLTSDAYGIIPDFYTNNRPDVLWQSGTLKGQWATSQSRPGIQGPTGPAGAQGVQGVQGNPGLNGAGTNADVAAYIPVSGPTREALDNRYQKSATIDTTIAAAINDSGTATKAALAATYEPKGAAAPKLDKADASLISEPTTGNGMQSAAAGTARTVALTGHSLLYGQDETAGTTAATNGATQKRSATPTTSAFTALAPFVSNSATTVINQAYPGDRTIEAINRWAAGSSGNVELFWLDTNDANNYGGYSGPLTDAQTAANLRDLIKRARGRGADVVVVGGAPVTTKTESNKVFASAQTERTIAERLGARYVDVGELLTALPKSTSQYNDAVHLSPEAYTLIGGRLAALLGPKGVNPPKVAPGRVITTRDMLHQGGTIVSRAGAADGKAVQITASNTIGFAVDVQHPTAPVARFRVEGATIGAGIIGVYYNLGQAGYANRFVTIPALTGSAVGYIHVPLHRLNSPGPESIVIRCESGSVELDSIVFEPIRRALSSTGAISYDRPITRQVNLYPVGGTGVRTDSLWDAMVDIGSGVSTRATIAQTTKTSARWTWDAALSPNSGVILVNSVNTTPSLVERGYIIMRSGTGILVRNLASGTITDVTAAGVFASATGVARAIIEAFYDAASDQLKVYVDGNLVATVNTPAYTFYMAGLLAGPTGQYASASCSIAMGVSNEAA